MIGVCSILLKKEIWNLWFSCCHVPLLCWSNYIKIFIYFSLYFMHCTWMCFIVLSRVAIIIQIYFNFSNPSILEIIKYVWRQFNYEIKNCKVPYWISRAFKHKTQSTHTDIKLIWHVLLKLTLTDIQVHSFNISNFVSITVEKLILWPSEKLEV